MFGRFDAWAGKTLFVPLIIRICQMVNWSQYRFANYAMTICFILFLADSAHAKAWISLFIFSISLVLSLRDAVLYPEKPLFSGVGTGIRLMGWIIFAVELLMLVVDKNPVPIIAVILYMFAVYAMTITRIPPQELEYKLTKRAL